MSGYFEGDEPREFLLEVEMMNFITLVCGSNSAMLPQTLAQRSRFGVPKRSAYMRSFFRFFADYTMTVTTVLAGRAQPNKVHLGRGRCSEPHISYFSILILHKFFAISRLQ